MERVMGKYPEWTEEQFEELINVLGEANAKKLLAGDLTVEFKEVAKVFFDKYGRRIPQGLLASVCDANRNFELTQPGLDYDAQYANRIMRLYDCLGVDTGITAKQLRIETERMLALIRGDSQIVNILNGVWLPVVMPPLTNDDLGTTLEMYLEGVDRSYTKTFSVRKFYNYRKGTLKDEVSIVNRSRHNQLIERMKQGAVMGIHFPNPLQGYSISADREQMKTLPKGFILSGMDVVIAMAMYPDVLACGWNTPGLDLAALSWQSADASLGFWANDDELRFGNAGYLAHAYVDYSGGLLFLG